MSSLIVYFKTIDSGIVSKGERKNPSKKRSELKARDFSQTGNRENRCAEDYFRSSGALSRYLGRFQLGRIMRVDLDIALGEVASEHTGAGFAHAKLDPDMHLVRV